MKKEIIIESCVGNLAQAVIAEQNGAHQIELCARLDLEGTTPNLTLIKKVKKILNIRVKVMIRPRGGNFVYTSEEIEQMKNSIGVCRHLNVDGVVLGILNKKQSALNIKAIADLADVAYPLPVTVHKAIDLCHDPVSDIKKLKSISNVKAVLTSGTAKTAAQGVKTLKAMIAEAGDKITIISAGKITKDNLSDLHSKIGGRAYHGRLIV